MEDCGRLLEKKGAEATGIWKPEQLMVEPYLLFASTMPSGGSSLGLPVCAVVIAFATQGLDPW